ncbi:NAD(P)/FAD-dependent oxidoreductase [Sandarakinorhabdus glacialis]|nr:FAD-dependent oxidoreductase [Polymorphobacter glacialis]
MDCKITIVGAGITGLACAQRLVRDGYTPLVLDKGRGIGGRIATRRVMLPDGAIGFDHGAQYLTARDRAFAAALQGLGSASAVWCDGAAEPHLVGVPGMSSLPRSLANGLDVQLGKEVTAMRAVQGGWELDLSQMRVQSHHLVITVPAPQAAALLGTDHALHSRIAKIAMAPCLTLMAALPGDAPRPFVSRVSDDHPLAWIAQNSTKPGRAGVFTTWVAQAGAEWSERHLEETPEIIAARMLPMLAEVIGVAPQSAVYASAHRWRYAQTIAPLGAPFLCSNDATLFVGGDWCLGARVEAAWLSGTAIAQAIIDQSRRL